MGLDMYLSKKEYVKNWDHMKDEEKHQVTVKKGGKLQNKKFEPKEIVYDVGYWRKANAIHRWFVDNVQGGEDDCREYYVPREKLQDLLDICKEIVRIAQVKKGKIVNGKTMKDGEWVDILEDGEYIENASDVAELLPTASGFFFGSTEYDQWYLQDVKETVEILTECLDDEDGDIYYQSSW